MFFSISVKASATSLFVVNVLESWKMSILSLILDVPFKPQVSIRYILNRDDVKTQSNN